MEKRKIHIYRKGSIKVSKHNEMLSLVKSQDNADLNKHNISSHTHQIEKKKAFKNLTIPYLTMIWRKNNSYPESVSKEMWWHQVDWASLVTQMAINLPPMREAQVQPLGWEDPLEKGMATHSSILPWKIHRQRSLAGYSPWVFRVRQGWGTNTFTLFT